MELESTATTNSLPADTNLALAEALTFQQVVDIMAIHDDITLVTKLKDLPAHHKGALCDFFNVTTLPDLHRAITDHKRKTLERKDARLRHAFIHFSSWLLLQNSRSGKLPLTPTKKELLECFITVAFDITDKKLLEMLSDHMLKGFSLKTLKKMVDNGPDLTDSFLQYMDTVYPDQMAENFNKYMKDLHKRYVGSSMSQGFRMVCRTTKPTNPFFVVSTTQLVRELNTKLRREH